MLGHQTDLLAEMGVVLEEPKSIRLFQYYLQIQENPEAFEEVKAGLSPCRRSRRSPS